METNRASSNITGVLGRAAAFLGREDDLDCSNAYNLMSPFIDSMATPDEVNRLQAHVSKCDACHRQLQSFISLRTLLSRIELPTPPEDLALETRVKLSRARHKNLRERMEMRLSNILRPIAFPAFAGVFLTMLFFGIMLGSFVSNTTVMAQDRMSNDTVFPLFKPVRTTDVTMTRFAVSDNNNWDDPLLIETRVSVDGRVVDYKIVSGPADPAVDRWVRELLYFAKFTPATAFGRPVPATIVISFVAVRS